MQEVLDALLEAVWLVDEESLTITTANRAACTLMGLASDQMIGRSVQETLAVTPQAQVLWSQSEPIASSYSAQFFTHVLNCNNRLMPVEQRVQRIHTAQGSMLMVMMLDRSEQQASERELETLLSELRATLDSAADGMLVCAMDGRVRAFNQRLATLWNMPRELLVQRNDTAVHQHMVQQVREPHIYSARLQSIATDPLCESTDILTLHSGIIVERRSVAQLVRGLPVGRVYSFRDITHQAEIQAGLRLAAHVFDSSLDAIFIADSQQRIIRMNPGCERLVGCQEQHLHMHAVVELFVLAQANQPTQQDLLEQVHTAWAQDGFWEGELSLQREDQPACAVHLSWVVLRDDSGQMVQSIGFMRDLTAQHAAQKRIEELAYSDALTGLPNRLMLARHMDKAIEHAKLHSKWFAILFLDLDHFKNINDSLGHPFGDRVLQLVASRLQSCLRQTDLLSRLGGDEFVIYLHGAGTDVAQNVAQRVLDEMSRPFVLDGMDFSVQCSIGMALYPEHGQTLDELVKQADTAMYCVKERGRGAYGFYQPQMNAGLLSRMQLEHAMRQALSQGSMEVHYQPSVSMETGCIVGAEALLRWTDPQWGAVSPATFIPLAEESGYIVTLGSWVLEQAIAQAARWRQAHRPLRVAVNVSALEFRQADFVQRLTQLLNSGGLPPQYLELEITETLLLQDAQEMAQRLMALAQLGVKLAIDDFGTGYSSLGYLKKLPIHKLKIDQSFVRGLPNDESDLAIVRAMISMGQALGIQVTAEGVETQVQHDVLMQLRCDYFQGYLCAPALSAEQFMQKLLAG